ncbi:glucoamylase family protein [Arcticibacter tournemirensis]
MKNRLTFFLVVMFVALLSCSKGAKESPVEYEGENDTTEITIDLTDNELIDLTQRTTFNYFWKYAEEYSGAARERYLPSIPQTDRNIVTTGGTGFGMMSIIVAIRRGFISRAEGLSRLNKILTFFESADRFHGAWPHWLNGSTGKVVPFSTKDNGGDLVETSFFAQGLLVVREYYKEGTDFEKTISNKADELWRGIEWNWYTKGEEEVLYWHWSPDYNWDQNLKITGFNECLVTYVLAASSPTHPISKKAYTRGWAGSGAIKSTNLKYGYPLVVRHPGAEEYGGPLFWSHYSFLGLNPRGLSDEYVNYGDAVVNHAKINYQYCLANPMGYKDYGKNCWGLTASYSRNEDGGLSYAAHRPGFDKGVISPTAAISSIPYTPEESIKALRYFYFLKDKLLGDAGFYDAFSPQNNYWVANAYLAIDQGPIIVMIENYRSGLIWDLFMECREVKNGLMKLGFSSPMI